MVSLEPFKFFPKNGTFTKMQYITIMVVKAVMKSGSYLKATP